MIWCPVISLYEAREHAKHLCAGEEPCSRKQRHAYTHAERAGGAEKASAGGSARRRALPRAHAPREGRRRARPGAGAQASIRLCGELQEPLAECLCIACRYIQTDEVSMYMTDCAGPQFLRCSARPGSQMYSLSASSSGLFVRVLVFTCFLVHVISFLGRRAGVLCCSGHGCKGLAGAAATGDTSQPGVQ